MASPSSVNVARLTYLLVCEAAGVAIALSTKGTIDVSMSTGILGGLGVAALFIWIEYLMKGFTLRGFSTATFGLSIGLLCAWLLTRVQISNLLELAFHDKITSTENGELMVSVLRLAFDVTLFASLGFLGAVLAEVESPRNRHLVLRCLHALPAVLRIVVAAHHERARTYVDELHLHTAAEVEGDLVGWRRLTFHLAHTACQAQDDNQQG